MELVFRNLLFCSPILFFSFLALSTLPACGGGLSKTVPPTRSLSSEPISKTCHEDQGIHSVFHISVDGTDVGREVRTDFVKEGPSGPERIFISHLVKNERMGNVLFPSTVVRFERTSIGSKDLLQSVVVKKDQVSVSRIDISTSDEGFRRTISTSRSHSPKPSESSVILPLDGEEVVGALLYDRLLEVALSKCPAQETFSFFDALHNKPFMITLTGPSSDSLFLDGQEIFGNWVDVRKTEEDKLVVRAFFDHGGVLWLEEYPDIHESRRRATGPLSLPSETSELIVGLRSDTYLYDPNIASRATYHLISTPDRLDAAMLLQEPLNQSLVRESPTRLVLTVHAGAPDGDDPPRNDDLGSSKYIMPKAPSIVQAYRYLRTAGKRGKLSKERRLNATPVVAHASLIDNLKEFWSDPDKVAGIIMRYVSALLPDKRHTFSMADAASTLENGGGDCTEHAVLFASLMRAHGIPTRLVTGMFLTHGGLWAYHMWASYFDGRQWRSIDPSTMTYRTGALHVALGRGASKFSDIRDRLADFMWKTFSGVTFNLVEASNEGEKLFLARPAERYRNLGETALFNAVVLSERGDHAGALSLIDENISEDSRSLTIKLMRAELLANASRCDDALKEISLLRGETSNDENTALLDRLELDCLLEREAFDQAEKIYHRIIARMNGNDIEQAILKAKYAFLRGDESEAFSLLESHLNKDSLDTDLLFAFSSLVSESSSPDEHLLEKGLFAAWNATLATWFSDQDVLLTLSRILFRSGSDSQAAWFLDHALILAPEDRHLLTLRQEMGKAGPCAD